MLSRRNDRRGAPAVQETAWEPMRWPVDLPASVEEAGSCALDVTIVDLSVTGCRFHAGFRLTPGRGARIRIPGFAVMKGRVVWSRDWFAAVAFDATLHPAVVRHLAAVHRPRGGDDG